MEVGEIVEDVKKKEREQRDYCSLFNQERKESERIISEVGGNS